MAGEEGFFSGLWDGIKGIGLKDLGTALSGIGSLAGAWGQYQNNKTQNKFLNKQFDYAVEKDKYAKDRMEEAQSAIDNAFGTLSLDPKKKKNTDSTASAFPA